MRPKTMFEQHVNDIIILCHNDFQLAIRLCNFVISFLPFDSCKAQFFDTLKSAIMEEQIKFLKNKYNEN